MRSRAAVGARLRARRVEARLTLAKLADRSGVGLSTLSRLENDVVGPNLAQLLALGEVYGCSLDDLVSPPRSTVTLTATVREGVTFIPLARPANGLHMFKVMAPADATGRRRTACTHGGHEGHQWVYVLSGNLRVALGSRTLELRPGQSIEFDTRPDHSIASADGAAVEVLMAYGPEGQRQQVVDLGRRWVAADPPDS